MKSGVYISYVKYYTDYKLYICFSDGKVNIFDYKNLVLSNHEEFKPYSNVIKFKNFTIVNKATAIAWGKEWDMILPIDVLYHNKFIRK